MALRQVFADRMVVGEVPVVHQGGIDAAEGMGAAGMPDAALGGEALVGDPDMGAEVLDLIVFDDGLGVSDHLENHDVFAVGQDEGLLSPSEAVIFLVQPEAVLVDELVFGLIRRSRSWSLFSAMKRVEDIGFHPDEIAADIRRFHFQARDRCPVVHRVEHAAEAAISKWGVIYLSSTAALTSGVEEGDMEHVIVFQHLPADAELLRDEARPRRCRRPCRSRGCASAWKAHRYAWPATGSVQQKPTTPQPPSSSPFLTVWPADRNPSISLRSGIQQGLVSVRCSLYACSTSLV